MSTPDQPADQQAADAATPTSIPPPGRRRSVRLLAVAVAAVLVVGAAFAWKRGRDEGTGGATEIAAEAASEETGAASGREEIVEASPRLLPGEGWVVTEATTDGAKGEGRMALRSAEHGYWDEVELVWSAADRYDERKAELLRTVDEYQRNETGGLTLTERASVSTDVEVVGDDAVAVRHTPTDSAGALVRSTGTERHEAVWRLDRFTVYVRGLFESVEAFTGFLTSFRQVDVDTWLAGLGPNVLRPNTQGAAVDEMLADLPLPPGFDPAALPSDAPEVGNRFEVAAKVIGAVACGWLDAWVAATDAGDSVGVERAVEVMATSSDWPILREWQASVEDDSLVPHLVEEFAAAMPTDAPLPTRPDEPPVRIRDAYPGWLDCER